MSIRSELSAVFSTIGNALDQGGREIADLKVYVMKNADRISPMLPGGTPRSDPPPQSSPSADIHDAYRE